MNLYVSDYHAEFKRGRWSVIDNDGNVFGTCDDEDSACLIAKRINEEGGRKFTVLLEGKIESLNRRAA